MERRLGTSSAKTLVLLGRVSSWKLGVLGVNAIREGDRLEVGAPSLSMEEESNTIGGEEPLQNGGRRNKACQLKPAFRREIVKITAAMHKGWQHSTASGPHTTSAFSLPALP